MKRVKMSIEERPGALEALNSAIQRAIMLMNQKAVNEATAAISIKIEVDPISDHPKIAYKTSIRVPIEMTDKGTAVHASQIYWDEELHAFCLEVDGEQVKLGE